MLLATVLAGPAVGAQEPREGEADQPSQEIKLSSLPSSRALAERAAIQAMLSTDRPVDRLTMVEEFLIRYPDSPLVSRAHLAAAEAYRMLGNFEKTIESGEKVLELAPEDTLARIMLADALVESTLPSQAEFEERYSRAEGLAREALGGLQELYTEARRPPAATPEDFDRERRFVESQPRATLGFIYLRRGEYGKAEEELKRSVELNQMSPNGADFLRLAYVLIQQSKWEEADAILARAFEFGGQVAVTAHQYRAALEKERAKKAATPETEAPAEEGPQAEDPSKTEEPPE